MYIILVGAPGIGKGLCIREISKYLKFWKLKDAIKVPFDATPEQKAIIEAVHAADLKNAQDALLNSKNKKVDLGEALLIPVSADAITYEALVEAVAASYMRVGYKEFDPKTGKDEVKPYGHSSICFALQELASLLRKRTDDTVNYMLGLYDCPLDYEYVTKTQGKDRVRRGCLNLIAGTTPSFMQDIFNSKLIDEGFSSRSFMIFAEENRRNNFFMEELTAPQSEHELILLEHIRKLTPLYGNVKMDQETKAFLTEWWDDYCKQKRAVNKNPKLIPYYARKNIHVMKVAMAEHFSESTELFIPLDTYKRAIDILEKEEQNMHLALMINSNNPIDTLARRIRDYLKEGEKNYVQILCDLHNFGGKEDIEKALDFLTETGQIVQEARTDPQTERPMVYYKRKKV